MLRIEYQIKMINSCERKILAVINADSAASWLLETTRIYGKIGIISVWYDERYD